MRSILHVGLGALVLMISAHSTVAAQDSTPAWRIHLTAGPLVVLDDDDMQGRSGYDITAKVLRVRSLRLPIGVGARYARRHTPRQACAHPFDCTIAASWADEWMLFATTDLNRYTTVDVGYYWRANDTQHIRGLQVGLGGDFLRLRRGPAILVANGMGRVSAGDSYVVLGLGVLLPK
jgi:hypothetical protein